MNCEKTLALFPEIGRGNLPPAEWEQISKHLDHCSECRKEFETELELLVGLGSLPLVECPRKVTDEILLQIEEMESNNSGKPHRWLLGATSLVAAGLALILLWPSADPVPAEDVYSSLEINKAALEAQWVLAKVVTVINRNETNAFEQVFGQEIPGAVGGSLRHITKNLQGEV